MTATNFEIATEVAKAPETSARLVSLDVFRGATIAAMILVNNPGNSAAYWPLTHAKWNGWTPTDLIFPFFLFIVGVSLVLSFRSRLRRGDSTRSLVWHTVKRSLTIFALGLLLNGLPSFHLATWRIPGVLQRIALAYFAAAMITLYCKTYARLLWIAALLVGYWLLMRYVPVPGYGVPGHDIPFLHPNANLAAYLDRKLMMGHLYERTRDPEGVLSTLPAIATTLCGVLTGEWLGSNHRKTQKILGMLALGATGLIAGQVWSLWVPINKNLWTSSYVLFTGGFALICLAICYWITDMQQHRGGLTRLFVIFGTNAITAYVLSELGGFPLRWQDNIFQHYSGRAVSPAMASLLYSLTVVGLCFLPIWWMYRRKIFLKV
ncbi:MAG TPA: heparan-alpha-glucosaminide N-acetyltransferase domain-containing protein [Terriglobales bacterium]|jgi:predicted acyltransferase